MIQIHCYNNFRKDKSDRAKGTSKQSLNRVTRPKIAAIYTKCLTSSERYVLRLDTFNHCLKTGLGVYIDSITTDKISMELIEPKFNRALQLVFTL